MFTGPAVGDELRPQMGKHRSASSDLTATKVGASSLDPYVRPAPPLDKAIPDRLRRAYDSAPKLTDRELVAQGLVARAHAERAERAHEASQAAYAADHDGNFVFTDARPAADVVMTEGVTPEDFDNALHMFRMEHAEREVSRAEAREKQEHARQAARCRVCGVLDVPTRQPVVVLAAGLNDGGPLSPSLPSITRQIDGGVVCAPCEAAVAAEYLAQSAAAKVDKRRTRAAAARDYLGACKR